jgi:hypothetical protein
MSQVCIEAELAEGDASSGQDQEIAQVREAPGDVLAIFVDGERVDEPELTTRIQKSVLRKTTIAFVRKAGDSILPVREKTMYLIRGTS